MSGEEDDIQNDEEMIKRVCECVCKLTRDIHLVLREITSTYCTLCLHVRAVHNGQKITEK